MDGGLIMQQYEILGSDGAVSNVIVADAEFMAATHQPGTYRALPQVPLDSADIRSAAKAAREVAVANIKVTTAAGNTFDGDETSQGRMSRAILVMSTGAAEAVPWVLADNTVIQADIAELTEALTKAGAAQAALWVIE